MRRSLLRIAHQPAPKTALQSRLSTRHLSSTPSRLAAYSQSQQQSRPRTILPITQCLVPRISHSQRSYSTEQQPAESSSEKTDAASESTSDAATAQDVDPVKKELETAKREIIELKDKYLRSVADFRNLQERSKRDTTAARDFAISKFARDLLDSVDNLDRALSTVPEAVIKASTSSSTSEGDSSTAVEINKDLQNLYSGLKMTETILLGTLAKHGLERFDPAEKSERFDPNIHEATFMAPMPDKEDGSVFTTVQKGFRLNGRVVRAAKVGVVKNS